MTYEEAKEKIISTPLYQHGIKYGSSNSDLFAALKIAVEALEKQIPKKGVYVSPIERELGSKNCPNCEIRFKRWEGHYCSECGQAIDWSDEE